MEKGLYDIMVERNEMVNELGEDMKLCIEQARKEGVHERTVILMEGIFDQVVGLCRKLIVDNFDIREEYEEILRNWNEIEELTEGES